MNTNTALSQISTNVNVGMDEVVSVFVARYEDGLFAKKDEVAAQIRTMKQELDGIDKSIRALVNASEYEADVPNLGFVFRMGDISVCWDKQWSQDPNTYSVEIKLRDTSGKRDEAVYTKKVIKAIPTNFVEKHEEVKQALETKNAELIDLMGQIKSVGRKERQIRGRISEMKLAESGFTGLLDNPEMLKLVEIQ